MWRLTILALLLLLPLHSLQRAVHTTPAKLRNVNKRILGAGEACGIYTLRCAPGLKCVPPKDDQEPLRTLRDGGGRCGNARSSVNATAPSPTTDTAPAQAPGEAPCRKRLSVLLSALGPQRFRPHQDIYLPNCNKDGFYKRKQCWSSRGRTRGKCWCVDENGTPLNPNSTQRSSSERC